MPDFRYKIVTPSGETMTGNAKAGTIDEAVRHLQEQGNVLLEVDLARGDFLFSGWKRNPLTGTTLARFTEQLGILLHAGLPLDRALQMLQELPERERERRVVERIRERVRGVYSLSQALEEEHGTFNKLYLSIVLGGEAGGVLDSALMRLSDYLIRVRKLRERVIGALIYPAFLLFGVMGSLVLLLAYVLPQFVPIFQDMNVPVPLITKVLMTVGTFLHHWASWC